MIGIVLGNGPSKHRFDRVGDFVIGCNIPGDEFSVDATVICDEEIVWILKNNLTLIQVPVIISSKVFEKMKELDIVEYFEILAVFNPKDWYNAAHYATEYLIDMGVSEIIIWGCDSMFDSSTESTTSKYVTSNTLNDDRFIRNWIKVWHDIYYKNPGIGFKAVRLYK